ncbi:MAG: hypothetical protein WC617_12030 [Rhodanobacter sp.]
MESLSVHLPVPAFPARLAGHAPQSFSRQIARQVVDDIDRLGRLEAVNALLGKGHDGSGPARPRARHHDRLCRLSPAGAGDTDDRDVEDIRMAKHGTLHFGRIDVLAARDDHLLDPSGSTLVASSSIKPGDGGACCRWIDQSPASHARTRAAAGAWPAAPENFATHRRGQSKHAAARSAPGQSLPQDTTGGQTRLRRQGQHRHPRNDIPAFICFQDGGQNRSSSTHGRRIPASRRRSGLRP